MSTAHWVTGDTRQVTAQLPDASVDLVLTSPPFLALRDYLPADHPDKQYEIGSEPTPAAFIDMLLSLTAEWGRVLAPHGSICVELGDTYAGADTRVASIAPDPKFPNRPDVRTAISKQGGAWPLDKSLTLIPELYRLALAYGINPLTGTVSPAGRWRVRNVVRWVRPNPPVGALGDKFRPATTDLVIACRARDRWFDLDSVRTPNSRGDEPGQTGPKAAGSGRLGGDSPQNPAGAPPLDWWNITPGGFSGAHYAVWPAELCVRPIEAMCPRRVCVACGVPSRRVVEHGALEATPDARIVAWDRGKNHGNDAETGGMAAGLKAGGFIPNHVRPAITTGWTTCGCLGTDGLRLDGFHTGTGWRPGRVLDPFAGTGTTLAVATGHGRDAIGIDLDERNLDLARDRIGMFLYETTAAELAGLLRPATEVAS